MRHLPILAILPLLATVTATTASAGPSCASEPAGRWMPETAMREKAAALGYRVDVFKVTKGSCYEI